MLVESRWLIHQYICIYVIHTIFSLLYLSYQKCPLHYIPPAELHYVLIVLDQLASWPQIPKLTIYQPHWVTQTQFWLIPVWSTCQMTNGKNNKAVARKCSFIAHLILYHVISPLSIFYKRIHVKWRNVINICKGLVQVPITIYWLKITRSHEQKK